MSSEQHHNSGHTEQAPVVSKSRVGIFILIVLIAAVIFAIVGILARMHAQKQLVQDTNEMAVPEVLVIDPKQGAPAQEIVLPGNMQAYTDAPIYARTSGYLKKW